MRLVVVCLLLSFAVSLGCNKPEETIPSVTPSGGSGTTDSDDSAALDQGDAVRFVADTSLDVPDMMCPVSCWPKVKNTLAAMPGVEGVQLAEQPADAADGTIVERKVELKLTDGFDIEAALAALSKINFDATVVN